MPELLLDVHDIGLFADFEATRLEIPHLVVHDPDEQWDEAAVTFDGDTWPTGYRGETATGSLACTARYLHNEHEDLVALISLFRQARTATDGRVMLRTAAGLAAGFDETYVGSVPTWSRPRLLGQAYDLTWRLERRQYSVDV